MKRTLASLVIMAGIASISGCGQLELADSEAQSIEFIRNPSAQPVKFDSDPSGAICDILSADEEAWSKIPAVKEYQNAFTYSVGQKSRDIWLKGVDLETAPEGSKVLYNDVTMPSTLDIKRGADVLIVICSKPDYETTAHAYSYREYVNSTIANLADPTWVVGDYIDSVTGAAYYHASKITVPLHK